MSEVFDLEKTKAVIEPYTPAGVFFRAKEGYSNLLETIKGSQDKLQAISLLQDAGYQSIGQFMAVGHDLTIRTVQNGIPEIDPNLSQEAFDFTKEVGKTLEEKGLITPIKPPRKI